MNAYRIFMWGGLILSILILAGALMSCATHPGAGEIPAARMPFPQERPPAPR